MPDFLKDLLEEPKEEVIAETKQEDKVEITLEGAEVLEEGSTTQEDSAGEPEAQATEDEQPELDIFAGVETPADEHVNVALEESIAAHPSSIAKQPAVKAANKKKQVEISNTMKAVATCAEAGIATVLVGSPGTGKTASVEALAKAVGKDYIDVRVAGMEASDLTGLPYQEDDNGMRVDKFGTPSWYAKALKGNCIVALEEFNTADEHVMAACLKLLNERALPNHDEKLPDSTWLVGCINAEGEGANIQEMPPAITNRLALFNFRQEHKAWLSMLAEGFENIEYRPLNKSEYTCKPANAEVANFLENKPSYINNIGLLERETMKVHDINQELIANSAYPTERSWTKFAKVANSPYSAIIGLGLIGAEAYFSYKSVLDIDIKPYLKDPTSLDFDEAPDKLQMIAYKVAAHTKDIPAVEKFFDYLGSQGKGYLVAGVMQRLVRSYKETGTRMTGTRLDKLQSYISGTDTLIEKD